jgi:hypothetical protein
VSGHQQWTNSSSPAGSGEGRRAHHAIHLPHKAVVTRVRFTLYDSYDGQVNNCALVRVALETTPAGLYWVLAAIGPTTNVGVQRLSDTTINYATIDNMNYGYFLQCYIDSTFPVTTTGIYGADVTFKITVANG